jgi:ATP-citrate lyase alpha-subunit
MLSKFRTILIGGESARKAALRIGEFDYLIGQPLSVASFVNPTASQHFQLVVCGEKWIDVPVYENLNCAIVNDQSVNSVGIHFNAKHVLYWVQKVVKYPQIKNVVILAEDVPERDARGIVFLQKKYGLNILGPSSLGMLVAGQGRIGEVCGDFKNLQFCHLDKRGSVGIVSKSGTITGELVWIVSQNSDGVSTVVQIGGDLFPATDFVHWLEHFANDGVTKTVVLAGEAGGDLEERAAEWYRKYQETKSQYPNPKFQLISVISGRFLEKMPKGQKFGHAGAKQEESGFGSAAHKIKVLKEAGVEVVEFDLLANKLKELT